MTNPISNYENVFDRYARNQQQQFQQLNGGPTSGKGGYLGPAPTGGGSLNYPTTNSNNQSANSGQHQLMGLPATNTMHQSRTNCSSPASNSSITSKSSPSAGNLEQDLAFRTALRFLGKLFLNAFNDAGESFV